MRRGAGLWAMLLIAVFATLCGATPAEAALKLCNKTSYILYAATGTGPSDAIATKGWTRLIPGGCKTPITADLGSTPVYVYARTSQAYSGPAHSWGGDAMLCAAPSDFSFNAPLTDGSCADDDGYRMPFAQVQNKGAASWTTTFTQTPALNTGEAARMAGLARLLADNGDKPQSPGSPAMAAELDKFRARMQVPETADAAALFNALETEALKTASPAGYSVCNDTNAAFWAALGEHDGKIWRSRGWWKVMPGACAQPITTALAANRIYLLVEGKGPHLIVSGKENFCVTSIIFEVEKRGDCKARGLIARGFAVTDTHGLKGYTAHVGEDGLLPNLRMQH